MSNEIQFDKWHDDASIPIHCKSGYELYALEDTIVIGGAGNVIVPTGIFAELPDNPRIDIESKLAIQEHLISVGITKDHTGGIGVIVSCTKIFDIKNIYNVSSKLCNNETQWAAYEQWVETDHELDNDFDVNQSSQAECLMSGNNKVFPSMNPHFYIIRKGEIFARLVI